MRHAAPERGSICLKHIKTIRRLRSRLGECGRPYRFLLCYFPPIQVPDKHVVTYRWFRNGRHCRHRIAGWPGSDGRCAQDRAEHLRDSRAWSAASPLPSARSPHRFYPDIPDVSPLPQNKKTACLLRERGRQSKKKETICPTHLSSRTKEQVRRKPDASFRLCHADRQQFA